MTHINIDKSRKQVLLVLVIKLLICEAFKFLNEILVEKDSEALKGAKKL